MTENQFKEAFKEFGKTLEASLVIDDHPNGTGKSKGQGFILFEKQKEADEAMRVMDQAKFNDRVVLVKLDESVRREPRPNNSRDRNFEDQADYTEKRDINPRNYNNSRKNEREYGNRGDNYRESDF